MKMYRSMKIAGFSFVILVTILTQLVITQANAATVVKVEFSASNFYGLNDKLVPQDPVAGWLTFSHDEAADYYGWLAGGIQPDSISLTIYGHSYLVSEVALNSILLINGEATFFAFGGIIDGYDIQPSQPSVNDFYFGDANLGPGYMQYTTSQTDDFFITSNYVYKSSVVPIPATLQLLGSALCMIGFVGWRKKKQH